MKIELVRCFEEGKQQFGTSLGCFKTGEAISTELETRRRILVERLNHKKVS